MAESDIATLAVKVKADISALKKGLGHARSEIEKFSKQLSQSPTSVTSSSSWGSSFTRGKDVGARFGKGLIDGIRDTWQYFTKRDTMSDWMFQKNTGFEKTIRGMKTGIGKVWSAIKTPFKPIDLQYNKNDSLMGQFGEITTQSLLHVPRVLASGISSLASSIKNYASSLTFAGVASKVGGGIGGMLGLAGKGLSYTPSLFKNIASAGMSAFSSFASAIPGRLISIFQTLNPFEIFTRSFLAFKTTVVLGLGTLAYETIKLSGEFEQFRTGFAALTGSAASGSKIFQEMTQFAAKTPFSITEVLAASKMLLGYGTEAKQLYPQLKMLGEITAAIGNDYINLQHVTYLFGTMQQQGHIFTRDLNQLSNIGIPVLESLAKVLDKDKQFIQGMVEAGKIGFPEMVKAFDLMGGKGGKFSGMMEAQSKTLLGLWRNVLDNLQIAGAKFGDILVKEFNLKSLLTDIMNATQNADMLFYKYGTEIKTLAEYTKSLVNYAISFGTHFAAGFRVALDLANQLFPKTMDSIDRLAKGGNDIQHNWEQAKNTMLGIFESIALGIGNLMDYMVSIIKEGMETIRLLSPLSRERATNSDVIKQNLYSTRDLNESLWQAKENLRTTRIERTFEMQDPTGKGTKGYDEKIAQLERDIEYKQNILNDRLSKGKADIDKKRGLFDMSPSNYTNDAKKFFEEARKNMELQRKNELLKEHEFKEGGPRMVADILLGGISPAMRDLRSPLTSNAMGYKALDQLTYESAQMLYGGMVKGAVETHFDKAYNGVKGLFNNVLGFPMVGSKDNPEDRALNKPENSLTPDMVDLYNKLIKEKTPYEELTQGLGNLKTLGGRKGFTNQMYGQGLFDLYKSVSGRLGDTDPKFAGAVYKGSAEDLSIQAHVAAGMFKVNAADMMNKVLEDSLEQEKISNEYLKQILKAVQAKDWEDWEQDNLIGPGG